MNHNLKHEHDIAQENQAETDPKQSDHQPSTDFKYIYSRSNKLNRKQNIAAYLFWKIQSHLTKLANQLRLQKLKTTASDNSMTTRRKD